MTIFRSLSVLAVAALLLAGCATKTYYTSDKLDRADGRPRILMMPPDVELSEVSASGMPELNAAWTQQGRANLRSAVQGHLRDINAAFVEFQPPAEDSPDFLRFDQMQKLHGTVGGTIAAFHMAEGMRLPAKKGRFEWSLGPAVQELGRHADADYALFVWVRDSYASPGRAVVKVMAAIMGVHMTGGIQQGYASLVDLKTGEVVWFNYLIPREKGDLRTPGPARDTVALLLNELPQ